MRLIMIDKLVKDNRGGKRAGSGRPPSGRQKFTYWITPKENMPIAKIYQQILKDRES